MLPTIITAPTSSRRSTGSFRNSAPARIQNPIHARWLVTTIGLWPRRSGCAPGTNRAATDNLSQALIAATDSVRSANSLSLKCACTSRPEERQRSPGRQRRGTPRPRHKRSRGRVWFAVHVCAWDHSRGSSGLPQDPILTLLTGKPSLLRERRPRTDGLSIGYGAIRPARVKTTRFRGSHYTSAVLLGARQLATALVMYTPSLQGTSVAAKLPKSPGTGRAGTDNAIESP